MVIDQIEDSVREKLHSYIEVASIFGTKNQCVFGEPILWHAVKGG
jgi:hypothetical protein